MAALTAVVLAAGVAAAVVVEPPRSTSATLAATGEAGVSEVAEARAAAEAAQRSVLPVVTSTPAPSSTVATTRPAAGDTVAPPLPGHRTPGAVVVPFKPGRTEWSGVSNGITIHVVMSPAAPRVGETVTFAAEATLPGTLCCGLMLITSDGGGDQYPPSPPVGGPSSCSSQEPKSSSVRAELHHIFNKAGRWQFTVSPRSGGICVPSESVYGSIDGTIEVGAGAAASPQGPALPSMRIASIYPYAPQVVTVGVDARDDDGYIDRISVDWGDGSATETYKNPQPCKTLLSGWPSGTTTNLPLWMGVPTVAHRYRDGNSYTITATVVSTGCDRTGEQRVSGTLVFPEPVVLPPISSIPLPPVSSIPPPPPISSIPVPPPGPPPALPPT